MEIIMAKGQMRSNRETRKPKQDKSKNSTTASATESVAGKLLTQTKDANKTKR